MEDAKKNKGYEPTSNKATLVRIKFKPGRAAEGVIADANGFAFVDAAKAEYLVKINYAEMAEEHKDGK
jgi:hypothetical protein